jgi:hypothetical protein
MSTAERVRQLHQQHPDWGLTDIALAVGCSVPNVFRHAKNLGLLLPRKMTASQRKLGKAMELYVAGVKVLDIEAQVGVRRNMICDAAREAGIQRRPRVGEGFTEYPAWVPLSLRPVYRAIARVSGEETAAQHCRQLKRESREAA